MTNILRTIGPNDLRTILPKRLNMCYIFGRGSRIRTSDNSLKYQYFVPIKYPATSDPALLARVVPEQQAAHPLPLSDRGAR